MLCVTPKIVMGWRTKKNKIWKNRVWKKKFRVATIVIIGNYRKP